MIVQTQSDSILHWLYTNAPAAWIAAFVAVTGLLLRLRKKPRRLVFRERRNSSLIRIWPTVRSQIKITFADRPIGRLGQIEGEVFNEGSDPIQHPTFTVNLPTAASILDARISPEGCGGKCEIQGNTATVTLDYLNPFQDHRQLFKVAILADGETTDVTVRGSGEGWSVRHIPLPTSRQLLRQKYRQVVTLLIPIGASSAVALYAHHYYGVDPWEVSRRTAPWMAVVFAIFGLYFAWLLSSERKTLRRLIDM